MRTMLHATIRLFTSLAILLCLTESTHAATEIIVGNYVLLENTPGQVIQIFVTGGDQIQGMNFRAQIGNDPEFEISPVFEFGGGPTASTIVGPGTIFEPINFGMFDTTLYPALFDAFTATTHGTVAAEGLLATLVIDTTGIFSGTWALSLANTLSGPTDWAGSVFNGEEVPNPLITDGSISVGLPEPSSLILATTCLVGFAATAVCRRRRLAS